MLGLYNTALVPFRLAAGIWSVWRSRTSAGREEWRERLARRTPACPPRGVWIHGASVGEARIVTGLAHAVRGRRPELPLAVSAITRTGRRQLPDPPAVDAAFFAPLDFPGPVRRTLRALRPAALALVETELWPNLLSAAHESDVALLVLNGRLTPRRMAGYRRLRRVLRPLLAQLVALGVQSDEDAARFVELGAPAGAITVTGSVKYDLPVPTEEVADLRASLGIDAARPVFVAGSTAAGEDAAVLDAYERCRAAHSGLLLVLAPRHPQRAAEVGELVRSRGLRAARLSAEERVEANDVLLVDCVGRLPALYRLAAAAFVGGSLVPTGGHNLLEPAAVGVPVLFGPHTDSVAAPAARLAESGGGLRVADAAELGRELQRLLTDAEERQRRGRAARAVVEASRGALERNASLLLAALDRRSWRPGVGAA